MIISDLDKAMNKFLQRGGGKAIIRVSPTLDTPELREYARTNGYLVEVAVSVPPDRVYILGEDYSPKLRADEGT